MEEKRKMEDKLFYHAENARCGDVIPKYIDGKYQIFYLKGWKDPKAPGVVHGWHRMESSDLVHMSKETPIHVQGGTGDLISKDGTWHLFACIFPENRQLVTHYISKDGSLDNWEYQQEDTFGPDGEIYDCSDWRDPRIIYREDLEEYWMFLAARAKDGHSQTGCVGLCVSKDLKYWEYREPVYYPQRFNGACECPDVFRMGDWYYLVFSSYTNLFGTYYVKCRVGEKEWQIPKNHRLDARAFYAAKTAGTESERYLFGWIPTKEENIFGFWPDKNPAKDYRTWDWGGSMAIHELIQKPDGDLGLALPEARAMQYGLPVSIEAVPKTKGWRKEESGWTAATENAQQMMLISKMPESCRIKTEILAEKTEQAGVVLHVEEEFKEGYYFYIEPEKNRLVYRSWLRMSEDGGKTFPYDVEMESPLKKPKDGRYVMELITEGGVGTVYVNQDAALSFRMCDRSGGYVGIFSFGKTRFQDMTIWEKGGKNV